MTSAECSPRIVAPTLSGTPPPAPPPKPITALAQVGGVADLIRPAGIPAARPARDQVTHSPPPQDTHAARKLITPTTGHPSCHAQAGDVKILPQQRQRTSAGTVSAWQRQRGPPVPAYHYSPATLAVPPPEVEKSSLGSGGHTPHPTPHPVHTHDSPTAVAPRGSRRKSQRTCLPSTFCCAAARSPTRCQQRPHRSHGEMAPRMEARDHLPRQSGRGGVAASTVTERALAL